MKFLDKTLELWKAVAIYMYKFDKNKYYKNNELKKALTPFIEKKCPNFSKSKYWTLILEDGINHISRNDYMIIYFHLSKLFNF